MFLIQNRNKLLAKENKTRAAYTYLNNATSEATSYHFDS